MVEDKRINEQLYISTDEYDKLLGEFITKLKKKWKQDLRKINENKIFNIYFSFIF